MTTTDPFGPVPPGVPAYASGPAHPGGAQGWAPPPAPAPARGGSGPLIIAICALVTAGLALLLALGPFLAGVGSTFTAEDPGFWEPVRGRVELSATGGVTGPVLSDELARGIEDTYGGSVQEIDCPSVAAVEQGGVVLCHGEVDGFGWTGIVFFEDGQGSYYLDER